MPGAPRGGLDSVESQVDSTMVKAVTRASPVSRKRGITIQNSIVRSLFAERPTEPARGDELLQVEAARGFFAMPNNLRQIAQHCPCA